MSDSVHGHDVIAFMVQKGGRFSRQSLTEAVLAHFGAETHFHTCSSEGMTAEQLVDLLAAKGKFVANDSGFNTHADRICKH